MQENILVEKLVNGGQGLGELPDGRKVFVWNALPDEIVNIRLTKNKKSFAEGIAEEIIKKSPNRVEPEESNYLATSPWQIIKFDQENYWKSEITRELFQQAGIQLPKFGLQTVNKQYEYRNKMEYSFWGDDEGLHLALYNRGSHQKQIVNGSKLAMPALDSAASAVVNQLNKHKIRAGDLKTLIVRCDQSGNSVASLFVKGRTFHKIELPEGLKGLRVYFSNPKSPASVPTELIYELGDCKLSDSLCGTVFKYDVDSFFQVNVPVFELALIRMKEFADDDELVDMYAGVGSIGLSLAKKSIDLVELDPATAKMAMVNAESSGLKASVTQVASEKALDYIVPNKTIIFDPPRSGLHDKVTERILDVLPPKIIYLSCNPATHARDIAKLSEKYKIAHFEVFNFFPRTPHIESLAILVKK